MKTVHDRWKVTTSYVTFKKNIKNLILNNRRKLLKTRVKPRYTSKSFKYWNVFFARILSFIGGRRLFIKAASLLTSKSSLNPCIGVKNVVILARLGFLLTNFHSTLWLVRIVPNRLKKGARRAEKEVRERRLGASQGFSFIMLRETKSRLDC